MGLHSLLLFSKISFGKQQIFQNKIQAARDWHAGVSAGAYLPAYVQQSSMDT